MTTLTIGSITLQGVGGPEGSGSDLHWEDEYAAGSDLVGQDERVTITGALVIQASAQQAGRRMTLVGGRDGNHYWGCLTRAEVEALRVLAAVPGAVYTVTLPDGRQFQAMFRRDAGAAVEAEPLAVKTPMAAGDLYLPTIRLVLV